MSFWTRGIRSPAMGAAALLTGMSLWLCACSAESFRDYEKSGAVDLTPSFRRLTILSTGPANAVPENGFDGCAAERCVIGIHGFMYDPTDQGYYNPYFTAFHQWSKFIPNSQFTAIGWDSVTLSLPSLLDAWGSGEIGWYQLASARADKVAKRLAPYLERSRKPLTFVCHSLGCVVTLKSIALASRHSVTKVVMLNAAVTERVFAGLSAKLKRIRLVNVYVRDDGILKLAGILDEADPLAMLGKKPLAVPPAAAGRWSSVEVCPQPVGSTVGTDLNNPNRLLNHLYAFEGPGMARLMRKTIRSASKAEDPQCGILN